MESKECRPFADIPLLSFWRLRVSSRIIRPHITGTEEMSAAPANPAASVIRRFGGQWALAALLGPGVFARSVRRRLALLDDVCRLIQ
jgi:hypothetical protein